MTTLSNATGSKKVHIRNNNTGSFIALYYQVYRGEEDVLGTKMFSTEKRAISWGEKLLR